VLNGMTLERSLANGVYVASSPESLSIAHNTVEGKGT
jgi:hypothetical protein